MPHIVEELWITCQRHPTPRPLRLSFVVDKSPDEPEDEFDRWTCAFTIAVAGQEEFAADVPSITGLSALCAGLSVVFESLALRVSRGATIAYDQAMTHLAPPQGYAFGVAAGGLPMDDLSKLFGLEVGQWTPD